MLGLPAELEREVIARLSWAALKSLALACKAARAACFERVDALRWIYRRGALPGVDLSAAFPSATRLVLEGWSSPSPVAFLDANHALLDKLEAIDTENEVQDLLLATVAQRCPRLTSLRLPPYISLKRSSSLRYLPALTQLTRLQLHLDQCSYSVFPSAASSIRGLRDLSLSETIIEDTSSLRGTTTFQRLTRLEFVLVDITGGVEFGCLAPIPSLRALGFQACTFDDAPNSLSSLTQLASLAFLFNKQPWNEFELPTSGIAALTNLSSLDIGSRDVKPQDLDQGQLQQMQRVLGGLDKLALGCFTSVHDAALLASIGCADLRFGGFQGCAAPAGGAPLLPSNVVRLQLYRQAALCPLVMRQAGLTSLSLQGGRSDADCQALAGAFPQLRALQLSWCNSIITAAGLAHLSALRHLQQLGLECPCSALQPAELRALVGITSMRRLVVSLLDGKHVGMVEQMLSALAAGARGLRQVLLTVGGCSNTAEQREALQAACDRVVAGCGRQELVMDVMQIMGYEAWEWMLERPAV
jgi:hypothetical protein